MPWPFFCAKPSKAKRSPDHSPWAAGWPSPGRACSAETMLSTLRPLELLRHWWWCLAVATAAQWMHRWTHTLMSSAVLPCVLPRSSAEYSSCRAQYQLQTSHLEVSNSSQTLPNFNQSHGRAKWTAAVVAQTNSQARISTGHSGTAAR